MTDDDLCRWSDLPPDQCALPCHRNESLPAGVEPEVRRGDDPTGFSTLLTEPASEQHEALDTRPRPVKPRRPKYACRWVDNDWLTRKHLSACRSNTCEGCKPCPEDHCALFWCPQHVDSGSNVVTCPSCIGEFRDNVHEVETLTALVAAELAYATSVEAPSNELLAPIWTFTDVTDVATMAGPHGYRGDSREALRGWCEWPPRRPRQLDVIAVEERDPLLHPLAVLEDIEHDLRVEYGQSAAEPRSNVSSVCAYLDRMCAGRFPHDEAFEKTFRDIKALRVELEKVLSDSRKPQTGAPCPTCEADPNVTRPAALVMRRGHWCADPKCEKEHVSTITDDDGVIRPDTSKDRWVCPHNGEHVWTDQDYRKFVKAAHDAHAKFLTAKELSNQYDIPTSTIRRWASTTTRKVGDEKVEIPPRLRSVGKKTPGGKLYRVADVLALRARETHEKETA